MSVNLHVLVGNVGQEPTKRFFPSGDAYTVFSIATNREYVDKKDSQKKQVTTWHNVVAHRKLAEVVEKYVKSGDKIFVQGESRKRQYDHPDFPEVKMNVTELHVSRLELLPNGRNPDGYVGEMDEELPDEMPDGMDPSKL